MHNAPGLFFFSPLSFFKEYATFACAKTDKEQPIQRRLYVSV